MDWRYIQKIDVTGQYTECPAKRLRPLKCEQWSNGAKGCIHNFTINECSDRDVSVYNLYFTNEGITRPFPEDSKAPIPAYWTDRENDPSGQVFVDGLKHKSRLVAKGFISYYICTLGQKDKDNVRQSYTQTALDSVRVRMSEKVTTPEDRINEHIATEKAYFDHCKHNLFPYISKCEKKQLNDAFEQYIESIRASASSPDTEQHQTQMQPFDRKIEFIRLKNDAVLGKYISLAEKTQRDGTPLIYLDAEGLPHWAGSGGTLIYYISECYKNERKTQRHSNKQFDNPTIQKIFGWSETSKFNQIEIEGTFCSDLAHSIK